MKYISFLVWFNCIHTNTFFKMSAIVSSAPLKFSQSENNPRGGGCTNSFTDETAPFLCRSKLRIPPRCYPPVLHDARVYYAVYPNCHTRAFRASTWCYKPSVGCPTPGIEVRLRLGGSFDLLFEQLVGVTVVIRQRPRAFPPTRRSFENKRRFLWFNSIPVTPTQGIGTDENDHYP